MSSASEGHWWEFYAVRYAQGTVVGAMIVYFLFSQNENLKRMLFLPQEPKDFGMAHLILLAVYGLTYCYIASAPILVMHAGRGFLFKSKINPFPYKGMICRLAVLSGLSFGVPVCILAFWDLTFAQVLALFVYVVVIVIQLIVLVYVLGAKWGVAIEYFQRIVDKRGNSGYAGYVESYRHLREHGNSFLIVVFQVFLAFPIYVFVCAWGGGDPFDSVRHLFLLVLVWVTPGAFVWLYATKIENHLQDL